MDTPLIQIEETPNPEALRLLPGVALLSGAPVEIASGDDVTGSPLAAALLSIEGVQRIMIGPDFVTAIRSSPEHSWSSLRPRLLAALVDFLFSGEPAILASERPATAYATGGIVADHIREVIERYVRPMLARDGGEATLTRFDAKSGVAYVRMGGACGGCPSGKTTLKHGIEQSIKRYVPEVLRVEAEGHADVDADPKARFRAWIAARMGRS